MISLRTILVVLVFALVSGITSIAWPEEPERTHEITMDDYFTQSYLTSCEISPDGTRIAYTEMRWDKDEDRRNTDLWVVEIATGKVTRLTFDPAADTSPRWAGDWIYFRSSRKQGEGDKPPHNGKAQVWRIPAGGGEVQAVTRLTESVRQFEISLDEKTLYYTKETEHFEEDEFQALRKEFKKLEYGHGIEDLTELWALDLDSWRSRKLIDEGRVIFDFTASPDGKRIAMLTRPDQTLLTNEGWSTVDIYDSETGKITSLPDRMWREEAPSPYGWLLGPAWSSDGQVLSFRVDFDGYPAEIFFAHFDAGDEVLLAKMTRPREVTADGAMSWMPDGRTFCFTAVDHARERLWAIKDIRNGEQGQATELTPGDVVVEMFSFASKEDLALVMGSPQHPHDIFMARNPGPGVRFDRVTHINPQVDTWKIPQISIVSWTSDDGTPVEGILELPPDYQPEDGPLPLVVAIHGGPTSTDYFRFQYWIYGRTLFATQGWALLAPNYRGSTGYGDKFLTDLIGNKNNLDVMDILAGVNALIDRGIADPDRMAVTGWSNGGYLTNCIITKDNRFKAASSGAGVFDTAMQWSIEDTPGHVINYSEGLPWTAESKMRATSPLFDVDKVTTPTLIHVGEFDERVPQEHSRGLYRALRHYLNVPTELIVYPGTGHGLTKYSHRKAKMNWDVKWFNQHVLGKVDEEL